MSTMGGSIGNADTNTWQPYTNATREEHANLVKAYRLHYRHCMSYNSLK